MVVRLDILEWNSELGRWVCHPAYANLMKHLIAKGCKYPYYQQINQALKPMNGEVIDKNLTFVEFHSQEGLTQFVLTWS